MTLDGDIHNEDTQMFESGFLQEVKWLYPIVDTDRRVKPICSI